MPRWNAASPSLNSIPSRGSTHSTNSGNARRLKGGGLGPQELCVTEEPDKVGAEAGEVSATYGRVCSGAGGARTDGPLEATISAAFGRMRRHHLGRREGREAFSTERRRGGRQPMLLVLCKRQVCGGEDRAERVTETRVFTIVDRQQGLHLATYRRVSF